jgi:hypothetical protein
MLQEVKKMMNISYETHKVCNPDFQFWAMLLSWFEYRAGFNASICWEQISQGLLISAVNGRR